MYLFSKLYKFKENLLSFLLALLPLSFIAGNMLINLNVILIILTSFIFFKKKIFKIEYYFLDKIILIYFLLIFFTAIVNATTLYLNETPWIGYYSTTVKSFFFIKYFFLYIVLRFLIENDYIKIKYFFFLSAIASLFVCFDIFFQYVNGADIFGIKTEGSGRKLGGPFGNEFIAGGYIQRFSIFSFFILPVFFANNYSNYSKYLIPLLFVIFFTGIVLSGNRMPLIIFLFSVFLIMIFQKQSRKYFIPFLILFSIIFSIFYHSNYLIKQNFRNFYNQISKTIILVKNKEFFSEESPQYLKEFSTFYDTWLINKYIGGGVKNFNFFCHSRKSINEAAKFKCNMHPHNYYLEILTETGIVGFLVISVIFANIFYLTFIRKYFLKSDLENNNIITPFIILFLAEIFPLKSTGSFFTTGNTTYLFLIVGIMIALARKKI